MLDDRDNLMLLAERPAQPPLQNTGAIIIPFPKRSARQPITDLMAAVTPEATAALINRITHTLAPQSAMHAPTHLAALGAVAGFAAQQVLLITGGPAWAQPARNGHLDRLLLSEMPADGSLWFALRVAAHGLGAHHLPNPQKLLDATLRCVGTTQLGRITLPLEYRLIEQPQDVLAQIWPDVRGLFSDRDIDRGAWPYLIASAAARRVVVEQKQIPPHVALRIVMQAALAMALIEPKVIPQAAVKPGALY